MIKRVVLTGGPGSGKTTVLENIVRVYESQGIKVIVVPETATEVINAGVKGFGDEPIDMIDFQELIMRLQLAKEAVYDRAVQMYLDKYPDKDVLVVYDRGTIDNTAYINRDEFDIVLDRLGNVKNYSELMNKYDLVLNLVGRKDFYTTENNKARSENVNEALERGERTLKSWFGHDKIKIIMPKDAVEDKINETLNYINEIFDKNQVKRQQKYLVDLSESDLSMILNVGKVANIEQAYLVSDDDVEKRIRKVKFNDSYSYRLTVYKVLSSGDKVLISEKIIDEKIYASLMEFKVPNSKIISKNRYYFSYEGKYMYLDVFDGNKEFGILEVNVSEDENIVIPENICVLDNVSSNKSYENRNISRLEKGRCLRK